MFIHLSSQGLIKISGVQAKQFLQGQLTCNLMEVDTQHSRLGAYCDHKGRMLTDFRIYYDEQDYYLLLNKSLLEASIAQLKKYAVFSKVLVEDCSDLFVIAGYLQINDDAPRLPFLEELPLTVDAVVTQNAITLICIPGLNPRYVIIAKKENFVENTYFNLLDTAANDRWQLENILAGIPTIYPKTSMLFTPHMLNYHLIHGISFNKGCFLGQEIIARTQHLGKLKRHTYRMQIITNNRPQPGDPIFYDQQEVGTVVDVSPDPNIQFGYQLLVMIHDEEYVKKGVTLYPEKDNSEKKLILQELPYRW